MNKLKEFSAACAGTTAGILLFIIGQAVYWMPILLHVFTAYVLWQMHGLAIGLISLCLPFASEIYAFVRCWINAGLLNVYTIATMIAIAPYILIFLFFCFVRRPKE